MTSSYLKILIVEDDIIIAKDLAKGLQSNKCEVVGIARNFDDAIKMFDELNPNFAIIDIKLEGNKTGIEVAKYMNDKCRIPFIYLSEHFTSKSPFYKSANETMPAYYLPKGNYIGTQLWHFIELALDSYAKAGDILIKEEEASLFLREHLFIKNDNVWEKVNAKEITHIEIKRPYCKININNKKGNFLVRQSLDYLLQLLAPLNLIRIHQSHAVNPTYIHHYNPSESDIKLLDDTLLKIGKQYKGELKNKLLFLE
jgi:two-component system, LytTR family, response regulator LytT